MRRCFCDNCEASIFTSFWFPSQLLLVSYFSQIILIELQLWMYRHEQLQSKNPSAMKIKTSQNLCHTMIHRQCLILYSCKCYYTSQCAELPMPVTSLLFSEFWVPVRKWKSKHYPLLQFYIKIEGRGQQKLKAYFWALIPSMAWIILSFSSSSNRLFCDFVLKRKMREVTLENHYIVNKH